MGDRRGEGGSLKNYKYWFDSNPIHQISIIVMTKKKSLTYEEKMMKALTALPVPLQDKRHNVFIYLVDDMARSNETRFEHIINKRHELIPNDIKRIPRIIKNAIFKIDKERKDTYNYYLLRNRNTNEYIKISVKIEPENPSKAIVKTIYITKAIK